MPTRADFSAELIFVCNSLEAGGIERVVSTLANEWSRRGRKVCVVTMHDRRRFFALDPEVLHVVVDTAGLTQLAELLKRLTPRLGGSGRLRALLGALLGEEFFHLLTRSFYRVNFRSYLTCESWMLRRVLRRVESPVVVSMGTAVNIITLKACRGLGRRVVISERTDPRRLRTQKNWDWVARAHYGRADVVTANTRSALRELREFAPAAELAFVPNPLVSRGGDDGLPEGGGRARAGLRAPCVLIVGRLVPDKSHDVLLEAFAQFGEEFGNWRLAVVGEGRLAPELRAQAEALGVGGRVDWHGVVPDPHPFYRTASIFALPSRVEGTPNALLEAMSYGLPVVVSDGPPGPRELVEDGETGLVVPVDDAAALAGALRRLARDEALRRRLGAAARERVREFDLPRALAAWESVVGLAC